MGSPELVAMGIDPGSVKTGYGILRRHRDGSFSAVAWGVIRTKSGAPLPERLLKIYDELMKPLAMGFRHLHPAMAELENQNKEFGEDQKKVGVKSLNYFNGVLAESEYVAGDRFTFADIQMITTTDFFIGLNQLDLSDYPEIERHTKLMSERPSFSA